MKIAVTTSDGFHVDEQFGNGSFYIFKVGARGVDFIETRNTGSIKQDGKNAKEALNIVYNLIKDCQTLYTAQIEKYSVDWFRQMGINPVIYRGEINSLSIN